MTASLLRVLLTMSLLWKCSLVWIEKCGLADEDKKKPKSRRNMDCWGLSRSVREVLCLKEGAKRVKQEFISHHR